MIEDERDRQLDVLLDSLLSSYSAAQPRPGLERRIRRQIEARNAQWRRWTLGFAAVPVAVALVMFAQMHVVRLHRSRPVSSGNGVVSGPPEHSGAMFMLETKPPFPSPGWPVPTPTQSPTIGARSFQLSVSAAPGAVAMTVMST